MADPKDLAAAAEKSNEGKPLPAMVSPTVNLVEEMREPIARRCRETNTSFSVETNKMWLTLLKKEQRVDAKLNPDFTVKRGGGGAVMKAKLEEKDKLIADLQAQLEALKAAKK